MISELNVSKTVKLDLCVSCGICKVSCPQKAIDLVFANGQYHPIILDKCNSCGICLKVCPGIEVRYKELYLSDSRIFTKDIYLGSIIKAYQCYAKDAQIRKLSTSGGMITSLIISLIKSGDYYGAFVLRSKVVDTNLAKLSFAKNINEIISASKSKYLPASVENVVKYISMNNNCSIIVVGTPCQIHGIKKFINHFKLYKNHNNILFLGLFCDQTLNYNLINYFQQRYANGREIINLDYRNKEKSGWPGDTKISLANGNAMFIKRNIRMSLKKFYQLNRCLFCIDKLNQMADISFGDCYIPGQESNLGISNIIIRTEKGLNAIRKHKGNFYINEIDPLLIASSQKIDQRKNNLYYSYIFNEITGHCIYPDIDINVLSFKKLRKKLMKKQKNLSRGKEVRNINKIYLITSYNRIKNIGRGIINRILKVGK